MNINTQSGNLIWGIHCAARRNDRLLGKPLFTVSLVTTPPPDPKRRTSNKPSPFRARSANWNNVTRNAADRGGNVPPSLFGRVEALPLRERRTWCPRMGRGGHAEFPRNINRSWTWHWPVHGLDSAGNRTRTGTFHVREQSATAFSPRQESCPRTIHVHAPATASIVRERAAATVVNCPQTVRSRELSTSANSSWTQSVRDRGLVNIYPCRRIAVSISPPIHFPIHLRLIPAYVLI
jgi:hypothetical protein